MVRFKLLNSNQIDKYVLVKDYTGAISQNQNHYLKLHSGPTYILIYGNILSSAANFSPIQDELGPFQTQNQNSHSNLVANPRGPFILPLKIRSPC